MKGTGGVAALGRPPPNPKGRGKEGGFRCKEGERKACANWGYIGFLELHACFGQRRDFGVR